MSAPITPATNAAPPAPPPPPPPPPAPDASTQAQFNAQLHKPAEVSAPTAAGKVDPSQKMEQMRQTIDASRVTATEKYSGANPFKRMDRVMHDFEKFMQTADQLPPDQRMGQLFQFQMQVQRASFDVQLVSKVVEHATSGARTILQTQA